jgi:hypothetical protein
LNHIPGSTEGVPKVPETGLKVPMVPRNWLGMEDEEFTHHIICNLVRTAITYGGGRTDALRRALDEVLLDEHGLNVDFY